MDLTYLAYLDESGNTGLDLLNPAQPIFLLGALVVPASIWRTLEGNLEAAVNEYFPDLEEDQREIHTHKLIGGTAPFRRYGRAHCLKFQEEWLSIAEAFDLSFFSRAIEKARFSKWVDSTYGGAVKINPHAMAFPLVTHVINQFIREQEENSSVILISDEHKELSSDLEKSLKLLRTDPSHLQHDRVIEKCFFIDSSKSLLLQLCDMCSYNARKLAEDSMGYPIRPHHKHGASRMASLTQHGEEDLFDVIDWMDKQIKKRPGT